MYFNHTYSETLTDSFQIKEIELYGMPVMELEKTFLETLTGVFDLGKTFIDLIKGFCKPGTWKPSAFSVKANIEFIETQTTWKIRTRENIPIYKNINKDEIQNGDSFLITRLDGLDPFIVTSTGSRAGHTTVAMRDPTTQVLHICESQWAD